MFSVRDKGKSVISKNESKQNCAGLAAANLKNSTEILSHVGEDVTLKLLPWNSAIG